MNNRENQSESKYLPALDRARCRRNLISQDVFSCWLKFDNVASQIPTHCMTQHRYSLKLQLKLRNNIDVTLRTLLYKTVSISLCSFNRTRSMIGFKSCEFARTHDPRMPSHARRIPLKLFRQVRVKSPPFRVYSRNDFHSDRTWHAGMSARVLENWDNKSGRENTFRLA